MLLSVIFEKSWRLGNVPEDWKKAHDNSVYKEGSEGRVWEIGPSILLLFLGKLWNEFSWGYHSSDEEHEWEKSADSTRSKCA